MANIKISELTQLNDINTKDVIPIVDESAGLCPKFNV